MRQLRSILCAFDALEDPGVLLQRAVSFAGAAQARLTVADLAPAPPEMKSVKAADRQQALEQLRSRRRERLAGLVAELRGASPVETVSLEGRRFLEVVRRVRSEGHDLVIIAAEDPEWMPRLFGSDDMHLLRKCPCPVWLTRPDDPAVYQRVLAAVDIDPDDPESALSPLNMAILDAACAVALPDGAALEILHVWDAPEAGYAALWAAHDEDVRFALVDHARKVNGEAMRLLTSELERRLGAETYRYLAPSTTLLRGDARRLVPRHASERDADLLVLGTLARTGIPGLVIGNTAEMILDQVTCSVLAIKPPGFDTPVR